jgi:hypothetical protein
MNELRSHLKQGDPVAAEPGLRPADIAQMRHVLLSTPRQGPTWRRGLSLALAGLLLCVTAGSAWFVRSSGPDPAGAPPESARLQLQFSTPGGTRVIWTFNPDLEVR